MILGMSLEDTMRSEALFAFFIRREAPRSKPLYSSAGSDGDKRREQRSGQVERRHAGIVRGGVRVHALAADRAAWALSSNDAAALLEVGLERIIVFITHDGGVLGVCLVVVVVVVVGVWGCSGSLPGGVERGGVCGDVVGGGVCWLGDI